MRVHGEPSLLWNAYPITDGLGTVQAHELVRVREFTLNVAPVYVVRSNTAKRQYTESQSSPYTQRGWHDFRIVSQHGIHQSIKGLDEMVREPKPTAIFLAALLHVPE
jgi:hypothetical protein